MNLWGPLFFKPPHQASTDFALIHQIHSIPAIFRLGPGWPRKSFSWCALELLLCFCCVALPGEM